MSHTPGPWKVYERQMMARNTRDFMVRSGRSTVIEAASVTVHSGGETEVEAYLRVPNPADEKLILASPELLAACKLALAHLTTIREENTAAGNALAEAIELAELAEEAVMA